MKSWISIHNIILVVAGLLLLRNAFYLTAYTFSQVVPAKGILEPGSQFAHFKDFTQNARHIGFLTDKDMSPEHNNGFFFQTQYILAPAVIHLNTPQSTWNILDFSQMRYFVTAMRLLGAHRVANNDYGQILVQRSSP